MNQDALDPVWTFKSEMKELLPRVEDLIREGFSRIIEWPATTRDAILIAQSLGYDVDDVFIDSILRRGMIDKPKKKGRARLWSRDQVLDLLLCAENLRRFIPGAELHWHKLSPREKVEGNKRISSARDRFDRFTSEGWSSLSAKHLLSYIIDEQNGDRRRHMLVLLLARVTMMTLSDDPVAEISLAHLAGQDDQSKREVLGIRVLAWLNNENLSQSQKGEPTPVEPSAAERKLSSLGVLALLDELTHQRLSRSKRLELTNAFYIACGRRQNKVTGDDLDELITLGDKLVDGDASAICKATKLIADVPNVPIRGVRTVRS